MASLPGIFRRNVPYTVVKFVRLSSTTRLEPGTEVPSEEFPLKDWHLRSLFNRRSIGHKDSPWTEAMLAGVVHPETAKAPEPVTIVNTLDPSFIEEALTDSSGEEVVIDTIERNDSPDVETETDDETTSPETPSWMTQ